MPHATWSFILLACATAVAQDGGAPPASSDLEFFETRIRPLLAENCATCHGAEKQKAGLRVDHIDSLLEGGESGPEVVRGKPDESRLLHAVRYDDVRLQMPPVGRLPDAAIADLARWIEIGAPWPEEARPTGDAKKNEPIDVAKRKAEHWCWQPIRAIEPPSVAPVGGPAWSRNAVDDFLLDRLQSEGLAPAPEADRRTLIRRVTFDLTGLPPSPDEVEAFVSDASPDAYERLVDRLLASPRYGERQARHWMDLFRFSETYGHEYDYPIAHAWRYRDYLIRALNQDVPYDRMVREHLAGDLLDPPRVDPDDGTNQSLQATAQFFFHQATHGPVDPRQDEADRVENQIDVVAKSFLGLGVSCARCHDHKFDAISTRDYYALAGFLKSSRQQVAMLDPGGVIEKNTKRLRELRELREWRVSKFLISQRRGREAWLMSQEYDAAFRDLPPFPGASLTFEAEDLKAAEVSRGGWRTQDLGNGWSGNRHMWWTGGKPGDRIGLEVTVDRPAHYRVEIAFTKARDYGIVRVALDAYPLRSDIDLYHDGIVATGFVDLGEIDLRPGKHRLEIVLTGANERAEKAYMVGIDQVRLTAIGSEDGWRERVVAIANERDLDSQRLERFARTLPLDRPNEDDRRVAPKGANVFDAFEDGFGKWKEGGYAFGGSPGRPDEIEPLAPSRRLESGAAHSGLLATNLEGTLRSRSFTIDSDWILYRVRGAGSRIRLIVDSFQLDTFNALLFEGLTFDVNTSDRWQWQSQRVAKYRGHRAHIEILDEGPGWIAVDEIVLTATAEPDAGPSVVHCGGGNFLLRDGRYLLTDDEIVAVEAERAALDAATPAAVHALGIEDGFGEDEYVFLRGKHGTRGPDQPRRFLEALAGGDSAQVPIGGEGSGRLELASRWLDDSNPLASRVPVNRIWHHLFGRGIVPTVDDFGKLGEPPSHPELLDWLAAWFRDGSRGGWSQKALVRLLVTSSAYRMTSDALDPDAETKDPQNRLLHRASVRRLEGEAIRDALLAVSGSLDPAMYGPSVPIHLTPFMDGRGKPGASGPLDGNGRRSVYVEVRRNFISPFMLAFDTPLPATAMGRRSVSNVPAQGLILMNDPLVVELASRWAEKTRASCAALAVGGDPIDVVFRDAYGRAPTAAESRDARDFIAAQTQSYSATDPDRAAQRALADLCQVLINAKEFTFLR